MFIELIEDYIVEMGLEYDVNSYPKAGMYIVNDQVLLVNKKIGIVTYVSLKGELDITDKPTSNSSGITEDFALRLTETILKNALND